MEENDNVHLSFLFRKQTLTHSLPLSLRNRCSYSAPLCALLCCISTAAVGGKENGKRAEKNKRKDASSLMLSSSCSSLSLLSLSISVSAYVALGRPKTWCG